jgi:hypothetical protein
MALPQAQGWLVDFPAASEICTNATTRQLRQINNLCSRGLLVFSACEKQNFSADATTRMYFCSNPDCLCMICAGVAERVLSFPEIINGKIFNPVDTSQKIVGATALFRNYGVITNKNGMFVNCRDILHGSGLHVLNPLEFLSHL